MIRAMMRAAIASAGFPPFYQDWAAGQVELMPARFRPAIARRYLATLKHKTFRAANEGLREVGEQLQAGRVNLAANDAELCEFAKARAAECFRAACRWKEPGAALAAMEQVARDNGINPPGEEFTPRGRRGRLLCERWWRRALRRFVARSVEAAAIGLGLVHRRAGLYASEEAVARRAGQKARNRALLEATTAENEAGQAYTLAELSDLGTANPEIRRGELMTRLAGFDLIAKALNHAAEFYTLTTPSRFHARDSVSGRPNPKYQPGITPREAQRHLCQVWARARAALHRRKIRVYGFRVAEPHHDGTPHWHMVLFMEPQHVEQVRGILKKYALQMDGNEAGAQARRFTAKAIDRSKGNAAGYLAKYIAKNIDGHGVGEDWEAAAGQDDAKGSARRVDAWASCWGVRQFQQIGGAPVSVWRELRRLKVEHAEDHVMLEALIAAADAGGKVGDDGLSGWARFVNLMGGAFARRADMPARCARAASVDVETGEVLRFNAYGEPAGPVLYGVACWGVEVFTRVHQWVLKRDGVAVAPWSSVNNCTRPIPGAAAVDARHAAQMAEKAETPAFSWVDWAWRGQFAARQGPFFDGVKGEA